MSYHSDRELVDQWYGVMRGGPLALTDQMLRNLAPDLDDKTRQILRLLVDQMKAQTEWILEGRKVIDGETARIEEIGKTMQRAGLRSYTDEKGRIFVASTKRRMPQGATGEKP